LAAALLIAGVAALRRIKSGDLMWPVFFAFVLLSVLDLKTGAASLSERLAPFSWIAVVMAIASRQPGPALVSGETSAMRICPQAFVRSMFHNARFAQCFGDAKPTSFLGKSGRHLFVLSISQFDPERTLHASKTCVAGSWLKTGTINQSLTKAAHL
jgi:hypothetical protein